MPILNHFNVSGALLFNMQGFTVLQLYYRTFNHKETLKAITEEKEQTFSIFEHFVTKPTTK